MKHHWFLFWIIVPDCFVFSHRNIPSTLSDNQIVAFIVAVFLCFFFYFGFEGLATVVPNISIIASLGMQSFQSMSRAY
jgi:hypothetical protein